jgi:hypothetical protein
MQECPQCGKHFDPVPTSGDFCMDCADTIRDESTLTALFQRGFNRSLDRARRLRLIVARRNGRQFEGESSLRQSRTRILVEFVVHQFIGTWGVAVTVIFLAFYTSAFLALFGRAIPTPTIYSLLYQSGYFPLHIGFALFLGWLLGRDVRRRSMLWVWVLPFLAVCYAVAAVPTFFPSEVPLHLQAGIGQSRLWHYFGPGCQTELRCGDQEMVTMHFYSAVAYSVGALLAPRILKNVRSASAVRFWTALTVGFILLIGTAFILVEALRHGQSGLRQCLPEGLGAWRWIILPIGMFPAIAGACLIDFAVSTRDKLRNHAIAQVS